MTGKICATTAQGSPLRCVLKVLPEPASKAQQCRPLISAFGAALCSSPNEKVLLQQISTAASTLISWGAARLAVTSVFLLFLLFFCPVDFKGRRQQLLAGFFTTTWKLASNGINPIWRPTKNAVCWTVARWMRAISELKAETSGCCARLKKTNLTCATSLGSQAEFTEMPGGFLTPTAFNSSSLPYLQPLLALN